MSGQIPQDHAQPRTHLTSNDPTIMVTQMWTTHPKSTDTQSQAMCSTSEWSGNLEFQNSQ